MNPGGKGSYEYLRSAVMTAAPEQLHLMLIDGAIRFALRGKDALERKDYEAAFNAIERAQRIVLELHSGLKRDVNPDLVDQMASLYNFMYRRLVDANLQHETQGIDDAVRILRHHRETWTLLIDKIGRAQAEPAVGSSEPLTVQASG